MNSNIEVVVTGIGSVTPYGRGTKLFWNCMREGKDGTSYVKRINTEQLKAKKGGEINWYQADDFFTKREQKQWDINTQYLMLAMEEALESAKIKAFGDNTGIIIGTLTAGLPFSELYYENALKEKYYPRYISQCYRSSVTKNIAAKYGIKGPRLTITTACSASMHAIGTGLSYIKSGRLDMAVVGGVDAFCGVTWGGFSALKALSTDDIAPFSKNRSGTLIGEGSGIIILESLESAQRRGAHIYGRVSGWGATGDAYHITAPNPTGETEAESMRLAIKDASMELNQINVIGAHGTATHLNDKMETQAIKNVFQDHSERLLITSIKSMIGHTMGAAGIHLAIAGLGMFQDQVVYPTIHYTEKDPECDLNYVVNRAVAAKVDTVLMNGFGFGGNNASVVLSKA